MWRFLGLSHSVEKMGDKTLYNAIPFSENTHMCTYAYIYAHVYTHIPMPAYGYISNHNEGYNKNVKDSYLWVKELWEIFFLSLCFLICLQGACNAFIERLF